MFLIIIGILAIALGGMFAKMNPNFVSAGKTGRIIGTGPDSTRRIEFLFCPD
jgi:hypothetical protein